MLTNAPSHICLAVLQGQLSDQHLLTKLAAAAGLRAWKPSPRTTAKAETPTMKNDMLAEIPARIDGSEEKHADPALRKDETFMAPFG